MKKKQDSSHEDAMSRNPNNWQGPFYVNKKDPRILVPKSNPKMGWTLNFGNIWSYAAIAALVLIFAILF